MLQVHDLVRITVKGKPEIGKVTGFVDDDRAVVQVADKFYLMASAKLKDWVVAEQPNT